ncbi:PREDICTED: uncharacterized protein LOC106821551 [Priapulus caudatus]|uniref:Uncharacterized protein LOC106821551 n=1 Tax=Priapulus caudatus TaxID=37621 RepID=A0ABM1FBT2_PRICU|nr:PREDICTED: uncharacterized protein LOC106821551 [Priapulus caudatus]
MFISLLSQHVCRFTVQHLLRQLDPEGVADRARKRFRRGVYFSKGPNHVCHLDGNDKLKPFGFCISGCIHRYSRKLLWLKAGITNKDPKVILTYYVNCIQECGGCPMKMRADAGTENVASVQAFLRRGGSDAFAGNKSFQYGRSTANQVS